MKVNFKSIGTSVMRTANKVGFMLKKHSPEILVVAGSIGTVASTVMACKSTIKAVELINESEFKEDLSAIRQAHEEFPVEKYSEMDYKKDLVVVYTKLGMRLVKVYTPSIIMMATSLGMIFASNNIMRKRNAALAASYATLQKIFDKYRENVRNTYGEEVDKDMRYGRVQKTIAETVTDENGKEKTVKTKVKSVDGIDNLGDFARMFNEDSKAFRKDEHGRPDDDYNYTFLDCREAEANLRLRTKGYLWLNEVYEMIGFPEVLDGQEAGWIYDPDREDEGDNKVSFGLDKNLIHWETTEDGLNCKYRILDFNIDGNIRKSPYLKLEKR